MTQQLLLWSEWENLFNESQISTLWFVLLVKWNSRFSSDIFHVKNEIKRNFFSLRKAFYSSIYGEHIPARVFETFGSLI